MAWNSRQNKSLNGPQAKQLGYGLPISSNPSFVGKSYRDSWDIERAYREGMSKITWVNRCIDAISGNQARLPIILRKDNSNMGEIVTGREANRSNLLEILNNRANIGENSFIFRYRLSAQLLLGTRGVFIEKIRGRDGGIIALNLLPPQSTAPIPDPKTFVKGYEVMMPYGEKKFLKPEDVCWVRRPHPLDPYLSLTPLEASGVAIEIENLAKLYNRNYLLNDGRPGGILVVRGEIDEDDKEELKSRFRGNLAKTGHTTVIAADDGVDYVDTSASPRDAAYIQMRQVTKEEILSAFGVPESVIGNAAGRTFSNAAEEIRVFWMETMLPHLEPIARALDELDDKYYVDFDTSEVPILMLYKQERDRYLLQEFQSGLISANEYRNGSSRKEVEADLADSLLANPNLIPIANTKKKMEENAAQVPGAPGIPGMPGMPGVPGMPPMPGAPMPAGAPVPLDPNTMQGAMAEAAGAGELAQTTIPVEAAPPVTPPPPVPGMTMASENASLVDTKTEEDEVEEKNDSYFEDKSEMAIERWAEILSRSIERVIERQQRVVLEKVTGMKARKALSAGTLEVDAVLAIDTWDRQMEEDIKPILSAIIRDSHDARKEFGEANGIKVKSLPKLDTVKTVDSQVGVIKSLNRENVNEIQRLYIDSLNLIDGDSRASMIREGIVDMYTNFFAKEQAEIAMDVARSTWNYAQTV
jgi:HK97 family phage portal protein